MTRKFANRLTEALKMKNITAAELSRQTGISEARISQYKKGQFVARESALKLIAVTLDIDEAWLLGYDVPLSNYIKREKPEAFLYRPLLPTDKMVVRFKQMLELRGLTIKQLSAITNISEDKFNDYLNLKTSLTANEINDLARQLNINDDWLKGFNCEPTEYVEISERIDAELDARYGLYSIMSIVYDEAYQEPSNLMEDYDGNQDNIYHFKKGDEYFTLYAGELDEIVQRLGSIIPHIVKEVKNAKYYYVTPLLKDVITDMPLLSKNNIEKVVGTFTEKDFAVRIKENNDELGLYDVGIGDLAYCSIENDMDTIKGWGETVCVLVDNTVELKKCYKKDNATVLLSLDHKKEPVIVLPGDNHVKLLGVSNCYGKYIEVYEKDIPKEYRQVNKTAKSAE